MVTFQSIVSVPLSPELKKQVRPTALQVLAILHEVAAVAVLPGDPAAYAQRVASASTQLAARTSVSSSKTEGQVLAAAKAVLSYYVVAQEIRAYKQALGPHAVKGSAPRRDPAGASSTVPYLLNSPVAGWLEQYPFLRASVRQSPQMLSFIEREGRWDPDQAVQLLWQRAQAETETLAQWLQG